MEMLGEFIGTLVLVLLGNGVVSATVLKGTKGTGTGWLYINLGWGFAVTIAVLASGFFSPAHLNPAVTIAMASIGAVSWSVVPGYIIAQILGAMAAQILLYIHYLPHYELTEDKSDVLATFSTAPAQRDTFTNFFGEMLGTAVLVIGVMAMGPNEFTQGFGPFVVGAIVTSIGISLGATTGYAINPARDLGPRIVHQFLPIKGGKRDSDWGYSWIPVLGPIAGGVIGALLYNLVLTQLV